MYPRTLRRADCKSDAEYRMFGALASQLDESWHAFHSVSWVVRDPGRGALDGEIDFVLAHPDHAVICLEVKGGKLASKHGSWQRWTDGHWEACGDPFEQALDHRYSLQRLIDTVDGWRGKDVFIVHALAFPDVTVEAAMAPDGPRGLLVDANDVRALPVAVERVLAFHAGARERRRPPGEAGVEMLRALIAPDVELRVPLAQSFREEEDELIRLTSEQAALLCRHGRNPRMQITGVAGSGKTMLAVEQAKRWRAAGREVLFVCFNRKLRDHLADREQSSGIRFWTFHALCTHLARRARVPLPVFDTAPPPQSYWDDALPLALVDAAAALGGQYDALVVDEAQDLHTHWLEALMELLRDPERDPVWLFMDDNQNVYDSDLELPPGFFCFDLTWNCRNTQAIHREVIKRYRGEVVPDAIGPEGRDIELHATANVKGRLAHLLERFIAEEGVPRKEVVILSSHALEKSAFNGVKLGSYSLTPDEGGDGVYFSSIRSFKGLETPVAILCELEDMDDMTRDQQLYVALSRARNHVAIVVPEAA